MYKKVLNYFVLIAVALLTNCALTACGDDDDDSGVAGSDIVGKWSLAHDKGWEKENGKIVDEWDQYDPNPWLLQFTSDGKMLEFDSDYDRFEEVGTYKFTGNKLIVSGIDEDTGEYESYTYNCTVKGDVMTMVISGKETEDGVTYEYYNLMDFKRLNY